ncbi:MAG: hypothetical protein AB9856_08915 [Cellulosilyticaceae bacterium]
MKELLGKIGESILNTCKEVTDQAEKAVDQTKYRKDILTLKNDLKKLYQRLGEEYYNAYTMGQDDMPFGPICNKITAITKEIDKLEKQVKEVVNEQKDSFSSFTREVKTVWKEEDGVNYAYTKDDEEIKLMKFCENCNVGNNVNATFCVNCGTKFE